MYPYSNYCLSESRLDRKNMKYKFLLRYTILLLCLAFVIERSLQCFKRFVKKPQAVEIKMTDGTNDILPHFTSVFTDGNRTKLFLTFLKILHRDPFLLHCCTFKVTFATAQQPSKPPPIFVL